jgi:hypothetical protein
MDRRRFLSSAAALAGAGVAGGLLPIAARAAASTLPLGSAQLLQLDVDGLRFRPAAFGAASAGLRLEIEAFRPGARSMLDALRVEALFDGGPSPWRHLAWHYRRDDALGSSRAAGFDLGEGFRGLALQAQAGSAPQCLVTCLDPWSGAALAPGRYVLLLDADADAVTGLAFSGDPRRPLGPEAPDHFSLRVLRRDPGPDLSLRADLACQDCAHA